MSYIPQSLFVPLPAPVYGNFHCCCARIVCICIALYSAGGVRRADESFETVSVDHIYIYMAMGRLRPKDGLISMKDLQVCTVAL